MESLERILHRNYNQKIPSPDCIAEVVAFIEDTDSVLNRSVIFIKELTKVAETIRKSSDFSIAFTQKLYHFHLEGIQRIHQGTTSLSLENAITLEAHFHGHAGSISRDLFKETKELSWGVSAYEHYEKAGDIIITKDQQEAAYRYGFAGDSANILYKETKEIKWLYIAYGKGKLSAELSNDPKHKPYLFGFAATSARSLYSLTKELKWLEQAFDLQKVAGELSPDGKHASHQHSLAGDDALEMYNLTKDLSWLERRYQQQILAGEKGKVIEPKHAMYSFAHGGNAAGILWQKTTKKEWLELCCANYIQAGEVGLSLGESTATTFLRKAVDIAYENRKRSKTVADQGLTALRLIPNYRENRHLMNKVLPELKRYAG